MFTKYLSMNFTVWNNVNQHNTHFKTKSCKWVLNILYFVTKFGSFESIVEICLNAAKNPLVIIFSSFPAQDIKKISGNLINPWANVRKSMMPNIHVSISACIGWANIALHLSPISTTICWLVQDCNRGWRDIQLTIRSECNICNVFVPWNILINAVLFVNGVFYPDCHCGHWSGLWWMW